MSVLIRIPITGLLLLFAALTAGDARAFSVRTVDLKVRDLVYNPHDGLLYVSVPGVVPERGNTVTLIDPATGALVASIPVGSEPNVLALSQALRGR
jgi:YVTN family beta-propeller protein